MFGECRLESIYTIPYQVVAFFGIKVISWLFVITSLPTAFIWPGCLLPLLIVSFLAEGTKLVFVDASVCQSHVWYPSGVDSLPQTAQSCQLGQSGYYTIAAITVFLISFLLVCFTAPKKRQLDESYGLSYQLEEGSEQGSFPETSYQGDEALFFPTVGNQGYVLTGKSFHRSIDKSQGGSSYDDHSSEERTNVSNNSVRSNNNIVLDEVVTKSIGSFDCMPTTSHSPISNQRQTMESSSSSGGETGCDDREEPSNGRKQHLQETREDALDADLKPEPRKSVATSVTSPKIPSPAVRISDSRLSRAEKLQLATQTESNELIDKFVMDLDKSFQVDS